MEITDRELAERKFIAECTPAYLASVRAYVLDNIAKKVAQEREKRGMFDALEREADWDEFTDLSMGTSGKAYVYLY